MPSDNFFGGTGKPQVEMLPGDGRVQLWTKRKSDSQNLRQLHESWWTKYWAWYRARVTELSDPVDWWRSNEVVPEIFKVVETILPRHIIGMFSGPEPFSVQATTGVGEEYEQRVQSLLMYFMEKDRLFPKVYECVKYLGIMGHVWGKVTWKTEIGDKVRDVPINLTDQFGDPSIDAEGRQRVTVEQLVSPETTYDDPTFDWVDLFHGWPDPSGNNRWFIEQVDVNYDQLIEANAEMKVYQNLELIRSTSTLPQDTTSDFGNEQNVVEGIPYDTTKLSNDGPMVRLWQCWGWVPPALRGPDGVAWRLTVIANGVIVIRDIAMPTPDLRIPYFPIKSIPIPRRLYGESIIRYIGPLSDQMNRIENWRMDEVLLNIWGQYIINRQAGVTDNKLFLQPGGAMFVDGNVNEMAAILPRKPVLPEAYNESANKREQIESTSAATPLAQGIMETNRATAREISTRSLQGNARFELITMWLNYTLKKEMLDRVFKLYQRHLPPGRLIRLTGQPNQMIQLDLSMIQEPVDIVINSGIFAFNKEDRLQGMNQMISAMAANPELMKHYRMNAIAREIVTDIGWRNADKFVLSEEEVGQNDQMNQQMQLTMAALQTQSQEHVDANKASAEGEADVNVAVVKGQFDLARERIRSATAAAQAQQQATRSKSSKS